MSPFAAVQEAAAAKADAADQIANVLNRDARCNSFLAEIYRTELATYRAAVEALRVAAAALPGQPGVPSLRVVS